MIRLISLIVIISSCALSVSSTSAEIAKQDDTPRVVKEQLPLAMEVEWIVQGMTVGFTGFFCEILGFSSAFRKIFPYMRVGKSSFWLSLDEPHYGGKEPTVEAIKDMFEVQLFPKESENLLALSYPSLPMAPQPHAETCSQCLEDVKVEYDVEFHGGDITKRYAPSPEPSAAACCQSCMDNPMCVAWSFGPKYWGDFAFTLGPIKSQLKKCSLKGTLPDEGGGKMANGNKYSVLRPNPIIRRHMEGFVSGIMPNKPLLPRALVFHGTMCLYRNESVHTYGRDINTLYVGRYMVERGEFPGGLNQDEFMVLSCMARMDEVWVPTEWNREVFTMAMKNMGIPSAGRIYVIPEAVDAELFDPALVRSKEEGNRFEIRSRRPEDGCRLVKQSPERSSVVKCSDNDKYRFLSIFKWEHRKGWDILLDAFWSEFTRDDDVVLILRTYVPSFHQLHTNITMHIEDYARKTLNKPLSDLAEIVWEDGGNIGKRSDSLTRADVRDFLASGDCFVLPTRGEGWGLPIAEAMSMQLPVIVTNATGPQAYITNENAYPIPVSDDLDDMAYVKPDAAALQQLMREVIHDGGPVGEGKAQLKAIKAREKMQEISPEYVAGLMAERLEIEAQRRGWHPVASL
jgi:glycosyltransferase involved in cell wall biosynthesis